MTLGAIAAAAFAEAQERMAERAVDGGESAVRRLSAWLRRRLANSGDEVAACALQMVERVPSRRSNVEALAVVLDDRAAGDAEFRARLAALVDGVQRGPVGGSFITDVSGNAHVDKIVNINEARDVRL
jgi:hypothetical protein